eukprot:54225-Eustigmatos_ZCMA.PRE.1
MLTCATRVRLLAVAAWMPSLWCDCITRAAVTGAVTPTCEGGAGSSRGARSVDRDTTRRSPPVITAHALLSASNIQDRPDVVRERLA